MIFVRTWLPGYESTAPVADIMGPREQRVPSGSTITLRCVILSPYQTRPIRGVQWLRDNKLLTFQVMQPQLDTRGRFNEISVWRSKIRGSGERKKGYSYIIKRLTQRNIGRTAPKMCLSHFCLRSKPVSAVSFARYASDDGWGLIDLTVDTVLSFCDPMRLFRPVDICRLACFSKHRSKMILLLFWGISFWAFFPFYYL